MSEPDARPTIVDVAAAAGVSLSTASKALNGRNRVDPNTRERVQRIAEKLDYRPNVRAQRLRTGRSHAIALVTALPAQVVSEASELGFLLELSLPIAQECLKRDHTLLLVPPVTDAAKLDVIDVDGAIVIDPVANDAISARLMSRGVRVVTIGTTFGDRVDGSLDRGYAGVDVMFEHLVTSGAGHIGVLLSHETYSLTGSLLNYLQSDRRIPARYSVLRAPASEGEAGGYKAVLAALRADPTIDTIYAPLDAFAVGAIRAGHELGLDVPGDLMVATNYDGRRATQSQPQITALDLHLPEIGIRTVDLLFRTLAGENCPTADAPQPTVIPRASTARETG